MSNGTDRSTDTEQDGALVPANSSLISESNDDFEGINITGPQRPPHLQTPELQMMVRSGPLPDAHELAAYQKAIPRGGEQVMELVKEQSNHRHHMENREADLVEQRTDSNYKLLNRQLEIAAERQTQEYAIATRGQWAAFGVVVICVGSAIGAGALGMTALAITLAGGTVLGLVGTFVAGRYAKSREPSPDPLRLSSGSDDDDDDGSDDDDDDDD